MSRALACAAACLAFSGAFPADVDAIAETPRPYFGATFAHRDSLGLTPEVEPRVTNTLDGGASLWCSSWGGHWIAAEVGPIHLRRVHGGYVFRSRSVTELNVGQLGPYLKLTAWVKGKLVGSPIGPATIRGSVRIQSSGRCSQKRAPFVARWIVPPEPPRATPGSEHEHAVPPPIEHREVEGEWCRREEPPREEQPPRKCPE